MAANESSNFDSRQYFTLIGKADKTDKEKPRAIVEVVREGDKYVYGKWYYSLTGFIVHAEQKDHEWTKPNGDKDIIKKVQFTLKDKDGTYQFEGTLNNATYGILNSLIQADFSRPIQIEAWVKDGFVNGGARYPGDKDPIKWSIPKDDQPKMEEFKLPSGETVKSWQKQRDFWLDVFQTKIIPKASEKNFDSDLAALEATKSELNEPRSYQVGIDFKTAAAKTSHSAQSVDDDSDPLPF